MSVPRFHVDSPLPRAAEGESVPLPEAVAHHAIRVLRLATGSRVVLFDGHGGEFEATLVATGKGRAAARLDRFVPVERELPFEVTLVLSLIAADAMDFAVRKAAELGAHAIQPVIAARSQAIGADKLARRQDHWQGIAIAASEQCGRNRITHLAQCVPLAQWWEDGPRGAGCVVLGAGVSQSLAVRAARSLPAHVLVGPEGGFTDEELARARARGAELASLGPSVLRSETAAVASLAMLAAAAELTARR